MITFIVPAWKAMVKRKQIMIDYLDTMDKILEKHPEYQSIVSVYGGEEELKKEMEGRKSIYHYVEENEGQELNSSKCYNSAINIVTNPIVAPICFDFRINTEVINTLIYAIDRLGDVIFKLDLHCLNEAEDQVIKIIRVVVVTTLNAIKSVGGWDERIFGWGKDDDDITCKIHKISPVFTSEDLVFVHIWHPTTYRDETEAKGYDWNAYYLKDNSINNSKNSLNTFW